MGRHGAWTDLRGCALRCTWRAQAVSAQVGHLIGDGLGACPVASIGLRAFRVYIGVFRDPGQFGAGARTDLAGCLLCPHIGTVACIVLHGVRGVATSCRSLNYLKLPSWILGLRYPTLRSGIAPPNLGLKRYYILSFRPKQSGEVPPGV